MKAERKRLSFPRLMTVLIIFAASVSAIAVIFLATHVNICGFHSIFISSLDLSGSQVNDLSVLDRFIFLKELDLSNTGLTGVDQLMSLDSLEKLDITQNDISVKYIAALENALPGCRIESTFTLGGRPADRYAESVVLDSISAAECDSLLMMDNLKYVDITECGVTDDLIRLAGDENCGFIWKLKLCGSEYLSSEAELVLESPTAEDLRSLAMFSSPKSVTVTGRFDYDELLRAAEKLPSGVLHYTVDLGCITISNNTDTVDMSDVQVRDFELFEKQLAYLPELTYLDMCRCGLSNEQMQQLRDKYQNIKFVWEITFGRKPVWWTVRTDIVCFSTLGRTRCDDQQLAPLLTYCTDLVALDIGHNNVTSLESIGKMKNLQVLIIGDNPISDLSPLANLPKLQYLEVFSTYATDFSPLSGLSELIDLCMGGNNIEDISPLLTMKQLKMLWVPQCGLNSDERSQISSALPECNIRYTFDTNLCEGWRTTDRNYAMRLAFTNWKYVVSYGSWDSIEFLDGAKLKQPAA